MYILLLAFCAVKPPNSGFTAQEASNVDQASMGFYHHVQSWE